MKAEIRKTEIYFDVEGMQIVPRKKSMVARPVLFMLHGGPGSNHLRYKQHSLEIRNVAQLVFIDHRGCGQSKKTKEKEYTLENNIEDVEALRKHLGLNKICLLGTSYGGMVAQGYAIRYAKNLEKLILVATAPSYRFIAEAKKYLKQHGSPKQIAICEKFLWKGNFKTAKDVENFFKIMEPLYSKTAKRKHKKIFNVLKTEWSRDALNYGMKTSLQHFDYIPKLNKIKCPTLILAGQEDWICRPNQAKIIASKIPKSHLKTFKNCGHAIAVDAHRKYIQMIQKFLQR